LKIKPPALGKLFAGGESATISTKLAKFKLISVFTGFFRLKKDFATF
jgi:hypothetical protein